MHAMRLILLLPTLVIPLFLVAQKGPLKVADKQFDLHAYPSAIQGYSAYLESHPEDTSVKLRLAQSYFLINQPQKTVDLIDDVLAHTKLADADNVFYAKALMMTSDYRRAEDIWSDIAASERVLAQQGMQSCQFAMASGGDRKAAKIKAELINSDQSEIGPCWSNGQLYYNAFNPVLANYPDGWVMGDQYHYLMSSTVDGNGFLYPPKAVKKEARPSPNEGPITISPDGKQVVFMRANISGNARLTAETGFQSSLFVAEINEKGLWENIRPFPYNGASYSTAWPRFTADGRELYFSSDRQDGLGGFDLYKCTLGQDGWEPPQNLGAPVNSPGNEITPYYTRDMLYFASDWHIGYGGYDLFKAVRMNDRFNSVVHLGREINSPADDLGLIIGVDPTQGYFVSNRKGKGDLDLYQFRFQLIERHILVKDAVTDQPIQDATLDLRPCGGSVMRSDEQGMIMLQMTEIPSCNISVQHPGFAAQQQDARDLLTGSEVFEISLVPDNWNFMTQILDAESGQPLQNVLLRLTEQRSGQFVDIYSDDQGNLRIPMHPGKLYFLNFSLSGYQHESRTVQLSANDGSPFTEPVRMKSILASMDPTETIEKSKTDAVEGKAASTQAAFAVQVASLTDAAQADIRGFERLAQFGTVYQKIGDERIRIRVGVFSSRDNARAAANEMIDLGYPGAFVVEESVESLMDKVMLSMAADRSNDPFQDGEYLIRLAAYKNPKWFDPGKLGEYGAITEEVSKEWTVKFVRGIATITTAREALRAAKSAGFAESHILFERDGNRLKVD
ncbi:MAG: SPOR domain-containing protein [Saprospiraceae bacterium]|nr:SPOR domain-containing protein [Saprospiraceae bacterium]